MGNAISLGASSQEIRKAVKSMYTDPSHLRRQDPGKVEGNVVFTYLDAFCEDKAHIAQLKDHYQRGGLGDSATKQILEECLQERLAPIRERRNCFLNDKAELINILKNGSEKAKIRTEKTLTQVKSIYGLNLF